MLASQLINSGFPAINLFDKVSFALQLMDEYDLFHLPVLSEEKFAGIISKEDLLDADAVFLSNAIRGIRWVKRLEDRVFEPGMVSKIQQELPRLLNP